MPDAPPNFPRASTASEFFVAYFQALEKENIPYVVLHGYERYPTHIGSDVDYAVSNGDLLKVVRILRETCETHEWSIAQILQHTVYGYYFVAFNRHSINQTIKLDVCSHYGRDFSLLLKDVDLLQRRRLQAGFYVPALRAEFAYVLAKAFAKAKPLSTVAARLLELADSDPAGCATAFSQLTGLPPGELKAVCSGTLDGERWRKMRGHVLRRHSRNTLFASKEVLRRLRRFLHPTGLVVGVLGVDGSGKSTLLGKMPDVMEPFFRRNHMIHFQPGFLGKKRRDAVRSPHAHPARGKAASWLKVLYYYADWLLGYFGDLRFRIAGSTLVLCDRTFDDIVVDPKRYRLQTSSTLANVLRRSLPTPDLTLVLVGPAESVHARKPELSVAEIERQQDMLRRLAATDQQMRVIDAGQTQEMVLDNSANALLQFMAERYAQQRML